MTTQSIAPHAAFDGDEPDASPRPSLDELLRPLIDAQPRVAAGPRSQWEWLQAGDWSLPAVISEQERPAGRLLHRFTREGSSHVDAVQLDDGVVALPFDPDRSYRRLVTERWRAGADVQALSTTQLRLYYRVKRLLPRRFWLSLRRAHARRMQLPAFPAWPFEPSVDQLLRFSAACRLHSAGRSEAQFIWFWPGRHRAAAILTHDVESADGLRRSLALADLEQERGLRSSFNLVAGDYPVDHGILRDLRDRGFEIGLHGLHHDRSLFSSRHEFERQLPLLADAARDLGAVGFRSPATHRRLEWLPELPVGYDCTVPHSDPYEPQPGGCTSIWPFLIDGMVELPYTLPQDHTLFTVLGRRSPQLWLEQLDRIEQRHGLVQCLSHPDRGYLGDADKRAMYASLLDALREREQLWKPLPREVAAWWRRRAAARACGGEFGRGIMRVDAGAAFAQLLPPPAP